MFALNSQSFGKSPNSLGYQGKEFQGREFYDGTGLEEYDFAARTYDPQLGRWHNPDPEQQYASPYLAMNNSWPQSIDPTGTYAFWDDVVFATVGGIINLTVQAIAGNVTSFEAAAGYFVTGAVSTLTGMYAGPAASGSALGFGNNLTAQLTSGRPFDPASWHRLLLLVLYRELPGMSWAQRLRHI